MTPRTLVRLVGAVLLLVLAGCGPPTKEDLLSKARDIKTRAELEKALGKPTDIFRIGPVEMWSYKASNGTVVFLVEENAARLQAPGTAPPKETK